MRKEIKTVVYDDELHIEAYRLKVLDSRFPIISIMEQHYTEHLSLDEICRQVGLSKSALLRAFTKSKSITPYCYLENIRIGAAKKLFKTCVRIIVFPF